MNDRVRVLIAEDDPSQLNHLRGLLQEIRPQWDIVAEVSDAASLAEAMQIHQPHLMLLDIHLGDDNSLEYISEMDVEPVVVFVTGDPGFAVRAFDESAADYILKPVHADRLSRTIAKVESRITEATGRDSERNVNPISRGRGTQDRAQWLVARRGTDTVVVAIRQVMYFQADLKYTRMVWSDGEALLRRGIGDLEKLLDPAVFLRVHRSTIVNIGSIDSVRKDELGRMRLMIKKRPDVIYVSKPFEQLFRAS